MVKISKEFWLMLFSTFSSNLCYAMMAPFYFSEAKSKHINSTMIGIVFAIYSIFGLIATPPRFAFLPEFSKIPFLILSLVLRSLQGIGNTFIATINYASASDYDKQTTELLIGVVEIVQTIGMAVGPVIGTIFYNYYDFKGPFLFVGAVMGLSVPFIMIFVKQKKIREKNSEPIVENSSLISKEIRETSSLMFSAKRRKSTLISLHFFGTNSYIKSNLSQSFIAYAGANQKFSLLSQQQSIQEQDQQQVFNLTLYKSMCIKRVILNNLSTIALNISYFMLEPYFQEEFKSYHVNDFVVGVLFSLCSIGYIIAIPLLRFIPQHWDRRVVIGPSLILVAISSAMIGHVYIPKNIIIMSAGLLIMGLVDSYGIIPAVSDNQVGIQEKFPGVPDEIVSNYVGGITNLVFNIPKIAGPPLGGFFLDQTDDFKILCLFNSGLMLLTALFYIPLNDPIKAYSTLKKKPPQEEALEPPAF